MHFAKRKSNLIPNFPFSLTKSSIILYFTSGRTSVSQYVSVSPESIFHPCQLCSLSWKCLSDTWVSRNWTTARVRRSIVHCSLFRGGVNRFYSDNNCPFTTVPQNNQMHQQPPWHLITPVNHIIGILLPRSQRTMLSTFLYLLASLEENMWGWTMCLLQGSPIALTHPKWQPENIKID